MSMCWCQGNKSSNGGWVSHEEQIRMGPIYQYLLLLNGSHTRKSVWLENRRPPNIAFRIIKRIFGWLKDKLRRHTYCLDPVPGFLHSHNSPHLTPELCNMRLSSLSLSTPGQRIPYTHSEARL